MPLPPRIRQRLRQQYNTLTVLTAQKRKNRNQICPNWNPISQTWLPGYTHAVSGSPVRVPIHINDISSQYARGIVRYIARKGYLPVPELIAIAKVADRNEQLNTSAYSSDPLPF